jgi:hypothetical protein
VKGRRVSSKSLRAKSTPPFMKALVKLSCECVRRFPNRSQCPSVDEIVYCPFHKAEATVIIGNESRPQYHLQCHKCNYARYFGRDEQEAMRKATKHFNTRHHDVTVGFGYKKLVYMKIADQPSLFDEEDENDEGMCSSQKQLSGTS